jgi:hypothetical protein
MKLPLTLLLCCHAILLAAERPTGFLGIPWGASPEEAKRILQKRPGVQFPENADDYHIEITGGSFAGQPVTKWVIEFPERKFAVAAVTLKTDGNAGTIYKEFCDQLGSKYGPTTTGKSTSGGGKSKNPQAPAQTSSKLWKFLPTMKEKSQVVISAELSGAAGKRGAPDPQGVVTIKYVNETLTGAAATAISNPTAKPAQPAVKKEDL